MNKRILNFSYVLGAISVLFSSVLVMEHVSYGDYLFAIGAALVILNKLWNQYRGDDFRLKRMNRYNLFSALILVGCSYLQFRGNNSWVILLLLVALLELFISLRTASYEKANQAASQQSSASEASETSEPTKPDQLA